MKNGIVRLATLVCSLLLSVAVQADYWVPDGGLVYTTNNVGTGVWVNGHFSEMKARSDAENIPLVVFWVNPGCAYCRKLEAALHTTAAYEWQKKSGYLFVFAYGTSPSDNSKAKSFARHSSGEFPYLAFYWPKNAEGKKVYQKYSGRPGAMWSKSGTLADQFIQTAEYHFSGYEPPSTYSGGTFAITSDDQTSGHRLEAEASTASISVNLTREDAAAGIVTNVAFAVKASGTVIASNSVVWAANQTNATVILNLSRAAAPASVRPAATDPTVTDLTVKLPAGVFAKDGDQLTLELSDAGEVQSTTAITYVEKNLGAGNPLWLGEKFGFGEWTCDLDAAKELVAGTDGAAYTLVSIQGSLWCPDCANTDRNFLDAEDKDGNNRFSAWAKAHNVALVTMDVPNYKSGADTVTNFVSPTIFSKKAFSTTLARAKEYPASGADASLTNAVLRSGLGYLTRKGASDEDALAVQTKFHDLAVTNTDQGGFHRPEDANKFRTGVPIFVLLRKDGTVAARFTRFAAVSPMKADQANFDNYIKRFDEMLALAATSGDHADATEIANNYPGEGAGTFAANGGSSRGELCNADLQDAFRLDGVGGNAVQQVTVTGVSDATVNVQFWKKTATGFEALAGATATGKLSDGVVLTQTFTASGDYYVLVKGADITSAEFAAANATENNFIAYEIKGSTVLVPQADQAEAKAPASSEYVTMRLVKDTLYCFSGMDETANAAALTFVKKVGAYSFFKAAKSGDESLKLTTGAGGTVFYQIWQPGSVGFAETARTVTESVNDLNDDFVTFDIARTDGKSGSVKVRVSLDTENSTLESGRYEPVTSQDFTWEDGVTSNQTFQVKILDDILYSGEQKLVFKLEVLASAADDVVVAEGKDTFTLTVTDDDKAAPGRGLFTRTTPDMAKAKTVYVREGEGAKIWAARIEASDGLVGAELKSSRTGVTFATENPRDLETVGNKQILWWSNRESGEKYVQVTGIPAGKSAKITLATYGTFKTVSSSNTVTVVAVADDAPAFATATSAFALNRYVAPEAMRVALDPATLQGGTVTFTKLSGSLPSGLTAAYDAEQKALAFTGVTTAKQGTYTVAYQVAEKRDRTKVAGLTTTVTFTVTDPTDVKNNPDGSNASVATTRTVKDIALIGQAETGKYVAGILQVTIPARGNVSAKYVGKSGSVSLSTKNWLSFDPETKALAARLENAKLGYALDLVVSDNGALACVMTDPNYASAELTATVTRNDWSKTNSAAAWQGYYTVALPFKELQGEETAFIASRGTGYLTLKMDTASSANAGKVTWAGLLPNGTAISGSTLLTRDTPQDTWVRLPIFKVSSTDLLSGCAEIKAHAKENEDRRCVQSVDGVVTTWVHGETRSTAADSGVSLGLYGSYYDKTEDLGGCCEEYFERNVLDLTFDTSMLDWLAVGTPGAVTPVTVKVEDAKMAINSATNPSKVTLSFNRSTGVVSGSAKLAYTDAQQREKTLSVTYKGVIVNGWGEGCGCGDFEVYLPFLNGSFYFSDKTVDPDTRRSVTVKRGGAVQMK